MISRLEKILNEKWDYLISVRNKLHENPEVSNKEFVTSEIIKDALKKYGIEYKDSLCVTGILAQINNIESEKTIALRADMDALSITEETNVPFASKNKGVMHACGHDAHMTMVLGAALLLDEIKDEIKGNIKFIFQPAEEEGYVGGAKRMIEEGVLENPKVDRILGMHVWPYIKEHQFAVCKSEAMAACDSIRITIFGKGGHVSTPHKCINSAFLGSQLVLAIAAIKSQSLDPSQSSIIDITTMQTSSNYGNIIPESIFLKGNVRSYNNELREKIKKKIENLLEGYKISYGIDYKFEYAYGYDPTVNNVEVASDFEKSAGKVIGDNNIVSVKPHFSAEDFGAFLTKVPGAMGWLGVKRREHIPLHNSKFIVDEQSIKRGIIIYCLSVLDYLNGKDK